MKNDDGGSLILNRRIGEVIKIGDDVDVVVLDVKGNQVKLGIDAPRDIVINRSEVIERMKESQD